MSGDRVLSPGDVGRDALHGFVGGVFGRALSARVTLTDCSFALGIASSIGSIPLEVMAIRARFSKRARGCASCLLRQEILQL